MGVEIGDIGTDHLWIRGCTTLRDVEFTIPSDRIVAGTWLLAGAATRGFLVLENAPVKEMRAILELYEKMGGQWEFIGGKLYTDSKQIHNPVHDVKTDCYPGFPTDLQSILLPVLLTIPGKSSIVETIFEHRFQIAQQLTLLGGKIYLKDQLAIVEGTGRLKGTSVEAFELRGCAGLLVAALCADGVTHIHGADYLYRGYEEPERRLQEVGGIVIRQE